MKKLLLLLSVITLTFNSCDSDDSPSQDSLIGTWNYYQSFENDDEYELSTCDKEEELIVNADGTFSSKSYYENDNETCTLAYESTGTWENLGDNLYAFTDDDDYTSEITITFSGDTFYIIDEDGSDTYKDVYIQN